MATILPFSVSYSACRREPVDEAIKRLDGIRDALSRFDFADMRTPQELTAALCTLSSANRCIKIVLNDFRDAAGVEQLLRHSECLLELIEIARSKVAGYNLKCATR